MMNIYEESTLNFWICVEMTAQGSLACGDDRTGRPSRVEMTAQGGLAVWR